ncbi:MAG: helix-turn-helix domain-containing protein [Clostridia bacterium]|nr:helix-turn-helix domain-containing protein [Clostridia bacterium]
MADEIFTVVQAAHYLQVCDKTVRRLINSNKLIASKVGDRSWRIRKSDIDEYLKTHTNSTKGVAVNE